MSCFQHRVHVCLHKQVFFAWNTQIQALIALMLVVVFVVLHVYAKVHLCSSRKIHLLAQLLSSSLCFHSRAQSILLLPITVCLSTQPFAREPKFAEVDVLGMTRQFNQNVAPFFAINYLSVEGFEV